jgi:hypothetical protein
MPMRVKSIALLPAVALLAACGGSGGTGKIKSAATVPPPPPAKVVVRSPVRTPPPSAKVQVIPGLEGVIGADRNELLRQFGAARLDVWEGDARKLQFSGTACVLDVYLYPPERGKEPEATYVDARRPSDGQDVDRAACVAALRKRQG